MEAGRELDILIGEGIFNYEVDQEFDQPSVKALRDRYDEWGILPFYSTDMNDAWLVADHFIRAGCAAWVEGDGHTGYRAGITRNKGRFEADADTAPLAICLAALKAIA